MTDEPIILTDDDLADEPISLTDDDVADEEIMLVDDDFASVTLPYARPETKSAQESDGAIPLHWLARLIILGWCVPMGFAYAAAFEMKPSDTPDTAAIARLTGGILLLVSLYALHRWRFGHQFVTESVFASIAVLVSVFCIWVGFMGVRINRAHVDRRNSCANSMAREIQWHLERTTTEEGELPHSLADWGGNVRFVIDVQGRILPTEANVVIAHDPLRFHDDVGAHFLYGDGHVEWKNAREAERTIARLDQGFNPP